MQYFVSEQLLRSDGIDVGEGKPLALGIPNTARDEAVGMGSTPIPKSVKTSLPVSSFTEGNAFKNFVPKARYPPAKKPKARDITIGT